MRISHSLLNVEAKGSIIGNRVIGKTGNIYNLIYITRDLHRNLYRSAVEANINLSVAKEFS